MVILTPSKLNSVFVNLSRDGSKIECVDSLPKIYLHGEFVMETVTN
jgi:hypothetical protein